MNARLIRRLLPAAALCAMLAGCLSIRRPYPDKRHYLFEAARPAAESSAPLHPGVMLQVRPFTISPRYEGQEFVYRTAPMRYESDFYNQFFLPPSGLLTESVTGWLRQSGLFGAVVGATAPVRPTHHLSALVTALYGDYAGGGRPRAVIEVQFLLTSDDPDAPVIVMQRDHSASVEISRDGAEGLMAAWNDGLLDILTRLEADLRAFNPDPAP